MESVPVLEIVEEPTEQLEMEELDVSQEEVFVVPPQLAEGAFRRRERRMENDQLDGIIEIDIIKVKSFFIIIFPVYIKNCNLYQNKDYQ